MAVAEFIARSESPENKNQNEQDIDNSLETTRQMLNLILPAEQRASTPVEIDAENEQHIEKNLEIVNAANGDDEKNRSGLAKCCSMFLMPFKKVTMKKKNKFWGPNEVSEIIEHQPLRRRDDPKCPDIDATEQVSYMVKCKTEEVKDKSVIDNFKKVPVKNDSDSNLESDCVYKNAQNEPMCANSNNIMPQPSTIHLQTGDMDEIVPTKIDSDSESDLDYDSTQNERFFSNFNLQASTFCLHNAVIDNFQKMLKKNDSDSETDLSDDNAQHERYYSKINLQPSITCMYTDGMEINSMTGNFQQEAIKNDFHTESDDNARIGRIQSATKIVSQPTTSRLHNDKNVGEIDSVKNN